MDSIYKSPTYQALVEAARAKDHAREAALIEQGIAESSGPEQAVWLQIRWGKRWASNATRGDRARAWAELGQLLATASDDLATQRTVSVMAFSYARFLQDSAGLLPILSVLRPNLQYLMDNWMTRYFFAELLLLHRRWDQALAAFRRALAGYDQDIPERQKAQRGRLAYMHLGTAAAAFGAGHLQAAAEHVAQAEAIYADLPENYLDPEALNLAQAELALHAGDSQRARSALQRSRSPAPRRTYPMFPVNLARLELMAARIARAEGNMVAFAHFTERALGICREHRLKLTERTVRAIMAGAEH